MDSISDLLYGIAFGNYETADKIGRDEINGYTVDTCDTVDAGYETAIWYENNDMVIVERYYNKEEAKIGHEKWKKFCTSNPKSVWSVQLDRMCDLK